MTETTSYGAARRLLDLVTPFVGSAPPVRVRAWDGSTAGPADAPLVDVRSRRALRHLVWSPGELGLARAYITGDLDVPGGAEALADGLRTVWEGFADRQAATRPGWRDWVRAVPAAARLGALGPRPRPPAGEIRLDGERHTRRRDADVIAAHYDLSNDFYALFLDPTMAYSSAYYGGDDVTLEQAQTAKLELVCDKVGLSAGATLLDVGCGWGSLALHAAEHRGARVVGITLSAQQHAHVTEQARQRGLSDRVEVRLQDYRALDALDRTPEGHGFDAVASLEMGEHVGEQNYATYLSVLHRHVRPGGRVLVQQMSRRAGSATGGGAFIETYIAPDMHMRPLPETLAYVERAGFEILGVEAMREDYVRTVADWQAAYEKRFDEAVALVGEEQARMWRLYLVGGGLAFAQRRMGVDQLLVTRAGA
ncbi:SAM-dependent methyltransferase [Mumia zhuanghuii]|uniref:Class I SAM-dependent methyltransferase n=1 Tax=Mumia zhuanghuii TaxID=2585211 RepID=A0A5C4MMP5_9ACTN|nr:cyclopropane-fatty-acyl-phospholipid synthase family protein [Mumia zhuanghuii]TNC47070.1 class I SAM-dependent methyltransferase [Mumia zhuanghuii]TNC50374.1 class I SAM-dependent methyltransferase [Mumia zhuanghuii]